MEDKQVRWSDAAPRPGVRPLGEIVTDLWGTPGAAERPGDGAVRPAAFPPFETFWRAVDETVDWTDALVRETPPDALTPPERWRFYHSQAQAVLAGDLSAYLTVLKTVDPLGDLKPYVRRITVGALDADTLRCTFQAQPAYLAGTPEEVRRYLAAVALRASRDLMALLPVCRVQAEGCRGEESLLRAEYTRSALQGVRFGVADPVAVTLACHGTFAGGEQAAPPAEG